MDTITNVLIVIFICLLIYYIFFNNKDEMYHAVSSVNIEYFFNPSCPHCRHFTPVWEEFIGKVGNTLVSKKINCGENQELCSEVRGVPFILFSKGEKRESYNGERTVEAMMEFLREF